MENSLLKILQKEEAIRDLENLRIQERVKELTGEETHAYLDGYADCLLYINKIFDERQKRKV